MVEAYLWKRRRLGKTEPARKRKETKVGEAGSEAMKGLYSERDLEEESGMVGPSDLAGKDGGNLCGS